jgi:hypothetical protein
VVRVRAGCSLQDGNGCVMWEELQMLKSEDSPDVCTRRYLELCERIGQANLFNPLCACHHAYLPDLPAYHAVALTD